MSWVRNCQLSTSTPLAMTSQTTSASGWWDGGGHVAAPCMRASVRRTTTRAARLTSTVIANSTTPRPISAAVNVPDDSPNCWTMTAAILLPPAKMLGVMAVAPPITRATAMVSPMARPSPSITPPTRPPKLCGKTAPLIISQRVAPRADRYAEHAAQNGDAPQDVVEPPVDGDQHRGDDQDSPQAEHHRWHGGEQVDDRDGRSAQPARCELGQEQRDADRDRHPDEQRDQRGQGGSVHEGERPEYRAALRRARVPGLLGDEAEAHVAEDRPGLTGGAEEDEREDCQHEQAGGERPQPEGALDPDAAAPATREIRSGALRLGGLGRHFSSDTLPRLQGWGQLGPHPCGGSAYCDRSFVTFRSCRAGRGPSAAASSAAPRS